MNTVRFESTHKMLKQFRKADRDGKLTKSISYRDTTPTLARVCGVTINAASLRDILKVYKNEIIEAYVHEEHLVLRGEGWGTRFKVQDPKNHPGYATPLEVIDIKLSDHDQDAVPIKPEPVPMTKQAIEDVTVLVDALEQVKEVVKEWSVSEPAPVMCQCERAPLIDQTANPDDMSNWCQMCEDEMENFKVVDEKFEKQARPYHDDDREGETVAKLQHILNRVRQERDQAQREVEAWQQAIMVQGYGIEEYLQDMTERLPNDPNRYDFADWSSVILTDIETDIQTDYAEAMEES